jgi:hypothetical protein
LTEAVWASPPLRHARIMSFIHAQGEVSQIPGRSHFRFRAR